MRVPMLPIALLQASWNIGTKAGGSSEIKDAGDLISKEKLRPSDYLLTDNQIECYKLLRLSLRSY